MTNLLLVALLLVPAPSDTLRLEVGSREVNGRVYEPHSAWVFRVEQGLIVEIEEYIDTKHSYEVFLAP